MTAAYALERDALDSLLGALRDRGFRLVGPVLRDGAICYDDIGSAADLPAGWTDEQSGGTYRVRRREDDALFGYNVGPQSWKKFLFPPSARLLPPEDEPQEKFAFIGVRACELRAIAIQDKVFLGGWDDVASRCLSCGNCTMVCPTCFCFSVEDVSGLAGQDPERRREWDSCFTMDHSSLHGGPARPSVRSATGSG